MESGSSDNSRTLWIGDLETWMDEPFLQSMITSLGYGKDLSAIKSIKDKATGIPMKYGFLEFVTHDAANSFYQNYNNRIVPNTNKQFKLNWAAHGGTTKSSNPNNSKNSTQQIQIYVGDLDPSVNEHKLLQFFRERYPSAFMSKIITDGATKISKGYGFIKFTNSEQAHRAITEMNGVFLLSRPLKVSTAFVKTKQEAPTENEETESQLLLRQKLYAQFYSSINDPQMKAEYQKQIQKTFGNEQTKKLGLKQSLEVIRTLTYPQTVKSQALLAVIPRSVTTLCKRTVEQKIYQ